MRPGLAGLVRQHATTVPFIDVALSSLVTPNITSLMWSGNYASPCTADVATAGDGAPQDGKKRYVLNRGKNAPASGARIAQFLTPPGCTSVSFSIDAMLFSGDVAATLGLGCLNAARAAFLSPESSAVLAPVETTFVIGPFVGLTPNTQNSVVVHVNGGTSSAQARAIVGGIRMIPNTALRSLARAPGRRRCAHLSACA